MREDTNREHPEPPPSTPPVAMPPYDQPLIDSPTPNPPGHPQAPQPPLQPPKKSNRTAWTIVIIVVGSVLALCCVGGAVAGYFVYRAVQQVGPTGDATRAFIDDLRDGDASGAYNKLCDTTKAAFPEPVFASIVRSEPQITSYHITSRNVNNVNGQETANVTAELNRASGAVDHHTFLLKRENGKWLVCGQPY